MPDFFFYLIAGCIVLAGIIIANLNKIKKARKKLEQKLREQWGRIPETEYKDNDMKDCCLHNSLVL